MVQFPSGAKNFPISMTSRSALGPAQFHVNWVPSALSLGDITAGKRI